MTCLDLVSVKPTMTVGGVLLISTTTCNYLQVCILWSKITQVHIVIWPLPFQLNCFVFCFFFTCSICELQRSFQLEIDLVWPNRKPPYSTLSDQEVQVDMSSPTTAIASQWILAGMVCTRTTSCVCVCWSSRTVGSILFVVYEVCD